MRQDRDLIYALFAAGLVGIACYGLIGYFLLGAKVGAVLGRLRPNWVYPVIFLTAVVAAYIPRNNIADVFVMLGFGLVGYTMKRTGLSPAALIIAFVLSKGAEESFRQSMLVSRNGMMIFLDRPFAAICLLIGVSVLCVQCAKFLRASRRAAGGR